MPTLVFDPAPGELTELIARRRELGLDRRDEVWEGDLHMIPPASHEHERLSAQLIRLLGPLADAADLEITGPVGIGEQEQNYRVPDLSLHRANPAPQWHPTAAL